MSRPMEGVRIVELAQFTFVPASGAVLADWGADVIKIEHAETGDAQRGLVSILGLDQGVASKTFFPIMEGPNRGKRSIGLDLETAGGRRVFEELIRGADVFVTNFREPTRKKLGVDVDDVRAINPQVIYMRGTGMGPNGDEGPNGGYDQTAFWARSGHADAITPAGLDALLPMPTGAYGDNIGGMTIAGGIAAALYKRAATGAPSVIDVSLLGVGLWTSSFGINASLLAGAPMPKMAPMKHGSPRNPLSGGAYKTSDERWIQLGMLQPGRYWPEICERLGRPELVTDERFDTGQKVIDNAAVAAEYVAEMIGALTLEEFRARMKGAQGQWALVQNYHEAGLDSQARANGYIGRVTDVDGIERELVLAPVQFDGEPPVIDRAPQHAEHTDEILRELGIDDDELIALKIEGAVT
ncbi:CaiB/BaiF CoA-transferase family protein [Blastococcus sp. URHD0036]|uniref:CaiB/BaiF CoA transferase family protein n=1 Tax=Blastococcus sp. URHD0036 TaxID=1380356 RepID=UPI000496AACA|nr:CaiB/BaiF CoA-transferase family protein [Blastococcus sp. URHD0036]